MEILYAYDNTFTIAAQKYTISLHEVSHDIPSKLSTQPTKHNRKARHYCVNACFFVHQSNNLTCAYMDLFFLILYTFIYLSVIIPVFLLLI